MSRLQYPPLLPKLYRKYLILIESFFKKFLYIMTPFPAGIQFLKTLPHNVFSKLQLSLGFDIARRQVSTVTARILAHLTSVFSLIFFSS